MHECRIEHKDDFYGVLCDWWNQWGFPNLPHEALPKRIFVVSYNEKDIYAMPVYETDTNTCFIGFVTGNTLAKKNERKESLSILNRFVEDHMKGLGFKVIMTITGTSVLKKLFTDEGYIKTGENYNEYLKIL
jgi:hypothetical protein